MNFSMPDKKNTLSMLTTLGALVLVLQQSPIVFTSPAQAQSNQAQRVFANSNYGYCDALKVASVWNVHIGQAKVVIGNKIMGNLTHLLDSDIASTAGRVHCSWEDLQMSYNDAVALGNFWGRQPFEAKSKASAMATQMGKKKLFDLVLRENGYRISLNDAPSLRHYQSGVEYKLTANLHNPYSPYSLPSGLSISTATRI